MEVLDINILLIFALAFILAFGGTYYTIPYVRKISLKKRLFDNITERSSHNSAVSRLGGVVFFPCILFSAMISLLALYQLTDFRLFFLFNKNYIIECLFLVCALILIYTVGVGDDLVGVIYKKKFLIQFLAAALIITGGVYIDNLCGLFGVRQIPMFIAIPGTILTIVLIANAMNLIDGVNGLSSGLSCLAFTTYAILFYLQQMYVFSIVAIAALGAVAPFLYYNLIGKPEKHTQIFMGDTGSLTLGILLAFLAIRYAMTIPENDSREGAMLLAFVILFVPVFDVARVICSRMKRKKPIFSPDRQHIHHKCLDMGLTHPQTTALLVTYSLTLTLLNFILIHWVNINILFLLDIGIGVGVNMLLNKKVEIYKYREDATPQKNE